MNLLIKAGFCLLMTLYSCTQNVVIKDNELIISYVVDTAQEQLRFFYRNEKGENYANFKNLKTHLANHKQQLIFAMNGGMYDNNRSPQGLYIEKGQVITPIDTKQKGYGNFYLQPNGIFYLTKNNKAIIGETSTVSDLKNIKYATQSGPMLVIDGQLHPAFNQGSANIHIRNGVGVLPDGKLLFAMSKERINFYDFATFFQENGCKNALYLDGFVSRMYLPLQDWVQLDGDFGVMIGEVRD